MSLVVSAERKLKCTLTEDEIKEIGRQQAAAVKMKRSLEYEFDTIKRDWKAKIGDQENMIHKCAELINDGFELRPVECEWSYNWEENRKDLTRKDTGEIIETLAITADERQLWMDEQEEIKAKEDADKEGQKSGKRKKNK